MNTRKLLLLSIFPVFVVLLIVGILDYSKWHVLFPSPQKQIVSQQMVELRKLEAQLSLPDPYRRDEDDRGEYQNIYGWGYFARHIALNYRDTLVLDELRDKLLKDSWKEEAVDPFGGNEYFSFTKGSGEAKQCVHGYIDLNNEEGAFLYVSLEAVGEYTCQP